MGSTMVGAFAQQIALPARSLVAVPDALGLQVAAAAGVAHRTAYHALRTMGGVKANDHVVVLGAAGGVGLASVELAAVLGARVTAVASTESKRQVCLSKGAHVAIDSEASDLKDRLKAATDGGSNVVIDPVGGPYAEASLRAMRWGGRFVSVGFASGDIPRIPLNLVLLKGVHVTGFTISGIATNQPEEAARDSAELAELLASGRVIPHISARYPLAETAQAMSILVSDAPPARFLCYPTNDDRPVEGCIGRPIHSRDVVRHPFDELMTWIQRIVRVAQLQVSALLGGGIGLDSELAPMARPCSADSSRSPVPRSMRRLSIECHRAHGPSTNGKRPSAISKAVLRSDRPNREEFATWNTLPGRAGGRAVSLSGEFSPRKVIPRSYEPLRRPLCN